MISQLLILLGVEEVGLKWAIHGCLDPKGQELVGSDLDATNH